MPSQRDGRARMMNKIHQKLNTRARMISSIHHNLFTATKGRIGHSLFGVKVVALTTTGRKSGQLRTTMVGGPIIGDDMIVLVASYGGAPTNPQWYLNLKANPEVQVTFKNARKMVTRKMVAREADGDERAALWPRVVAVFTKFEELQADTERRIPVVVLEPAK
jgi:deazaflavin-dependent oxidoreductase (nitroreductase family)